MNIGDYLGDRIVSWVVGRGSWGVGRVSYLMHVCGIWNGLMHNDGNLIVHQIVFYYG